jgi:hypothetical protein
MTFCIVVKSLVEASTISMADSGFEAVIYWMAKKRRGTAITTASTNR